MSAVPVWLQWAGLIALGAGLVWAMWFSFKNREPGDDDDRDY